MKTEARRTHSTIGLKSSTKAMLDRCRAPGQCYDGFLCQLMDTWEKAHKRSGFEINRRMA